MKNIFLLILSVFCYLFIISCGDDLQGEIITKYHTGEPKKIHYYTYEGNDKILKKVTVLNINGQKEQEGEMNGKHKNGEWLYWHIENGEQWIEENYKNGLLDGETKVWYKSGKIEYKGNYKNGMPHGKWTYYNQEGNKIRTENYENGKLQLQD